MPRIAAVALVVAVLLGAVPGSASAHEVRPGEPMIFDGRAGLRTTLIALEGDYAVDWSAEGTCIFNVSLKSTDRTGEDWLVRNVNIAGTDSRQTHTYGLPHGHYYLDVTGSCPWRVALTPLRP